MKIKQVASHRNGVSGAPFYVVLFHDKSCGDAVAIVFPQADDNGEYSERDTVNTCRVAVLNIEMLADENIKFANGNSWRGDHYAEALARAITDYEKAENVKWAARGL